MLLALLLATLPPVSLQATKATLDNGLTVIVSPDHSTPGVAVQLRYHVGSKDEEQHRTGFAHLFEHLMFMGARHVPYPRFDTIMEELGGQNNASTGSDVTEYHETGPANLLETFLWMEADRLATLGLTMTQEKLETQRKVVLNERRQSYENRPYGLASLAVDERLFPEGHPYHWPTIGSAKDLEDARLDDVTRFFARWYVPSNAVLAIVGDVEPEQAFALARKYFGFLPRREVPARAKVPVLPLQGEQHVALSDKVELPKLLLAWQSPAEYSPGDAECDLLATILANGKASRLYERLVHKDEIATEVGASQASRELVSAFDIDVMARPGHTTAELQKAVDEELERIKAEGPTQAEVDSARVRLYTDESRLLEGILGRARLLANYEQKVGNPLWLTQDLMRYEKATPASIREAARRVLGAGRVRVEVQPLPAAAAEGKAGER